MRCRTNDEDMDNDVISSDQLRPVLRLALRTSATEIHTFEGPIDEKNPVIRKLVEKILFSRRFILTYYFVLAIGILIWSCTRWIWKSKRKHNLWNKVVISSSPSSSSSSTLCEDVSPPKIDVVDENAPLLGKTKLSEEINRSTRSRLWCHLQGFLVAQPEPLPALTAQTNSLPSNDITIITIAFMAINIFYLLYQTPFSKSMLFAFADRAGLLFVVNLPILYTLAAKNNQPLKWLTGWSYESLNLFHRRLGEWMTIAALLHGVSMIGVWWTLLHPFGYSLGWYLTRKVILIGLVALILYCLIFFTSVGYVRQLVYEIFLASHIVLQVAALIMLFLHHHNARPYVGVALAIWAIDRMVLRFLLSMRSFVANLQIAPDGETVLLFCDLPVSKGSRLTIRGGWRAGQHVFVSIPEIGLSHRLQSHPFTIASPAPSADIKEGTWPLQLIIRAKDGFSLELLQYAKFHQHTRVYLDGPYGNTEAIETMQSSDRVCLVAGGSGIAVTYPLAWELQNGLGNCDAPVDIRTRYLNGRKWSPRISMPCAALGTEHYAHLWVRQRLHQDRWVSFYPAQISKTAARDRHAVDDEEHFISELVTERFATRDLTDSSSCRPDMGLAVREWTRGTEKANIHKSQKICVVVSGPDTLVREIRNTVASLIREGWNIEIIVEKFGW